MTIWRASTLITLLLRKKTQIILKSISPMAHIASFKQERTLKYLRMIQSEIIKVKMRNLKVQSFKKKLPLLSTKTSSK